VVIPENRESQEDFETDEAARPFDGVRVEIASAWFGPDIEGMPPVSTANASLDHCCVREEHARSHAEARGIPARTIRVFTVW
jgi:hypothetical protein